MSHLGELLSAYLDGELAPDEHNRAMTHLGSCARCQDDLSSLHRARAAVRSLPIIEAPQWLLGDASEASAPRLRPLRWVAAAAAALLVVTIGVAAWVTPPTDLLLDYSDIADAHRVRASQDGTPTGARLVQIVQFTPDGAE